ncbi:MAG: hypothetical protein L0H64_21305 [Pseudonocardia sp.]|nr:hypothetical protein [Pseudonocardia sp.]
MSGAAHEARTGREVNGLVRERLTQQATLLTRARKSHTGETREELLDRIDDRIRGDIDGGLAGVAATALAAHEQAPTAQAWSPQGVIETALADVQARKAGWTEADLISAIDAALPDDLGIPDGRDVGELLDQLAAEAKKYATNLDTARPGGEHLPDAMRLGNGDSVYQAPGARLYATPDQVRTERALVAATTAGDAARLPRDVAQRFLGELAESGIELGADQAVAVLGVLTSGARVETLIGPGPASRSSRPKACRPATSPPGWARSAASPPEPDPVLVDLRRFFRTNDGGLPSFRSDEIYAGFRTTLGEGRSTEASLTDLGAQIDLDGVGALVERDGVGGRR